MQALQNRIGYQFRDTGLLARALTHPSIAKQKNNQRLEFLGDSVLTLVVSRILYDLFPDEKEGELARRRAELVRGATLAAIAREVGLGPVMNIGISEKNGGGRDNESNLEDALEALIGAIYLDGGLKAAEDFITPHWSRLAKNAVIAPKDAKTALQEWAQGRGLALPDYKLLGSEGAAHSPVFTIEVTVSGFLPESAKAQSKRSAEQAAAARLLERLTSE